MSSQLELQEISSPISKTLTTEQLSNMPLSSTFPPPDLDPELKPYETFFIKVSGMVHCFNDILLSILRTDFVFCNFSYR